MKIDTDLRLTIRSAEKAQPEHSWEAKRVLEQESIAELLKRKPTLAAAVKKAKAIYKRADELRAQGAKLFPDLGVDVDLSRIRDEEAFAKAGGKLPGPEKRRWKFDAVITELAKADAKQSRAILAKYGIKWE